MIETEKQKTGSQERELSIKPRASLQIWTKNLR